MARRPRRDLVVPGLPHHVILRGNNRRTLFSYPTCFRAFLDYVGRASAKYGLPLHALVLMRNHTHLVATPDDADHLAAWVKAFAQRYASRRNRDRESSGKLFEQRYTSKPIRTESQLAATLAYVELNPVRAGMIEDVAAYPWSTYRLHAGLDGAPPEVAAVWTPHDWWTALATEPEVRCDAYRRFVADRLAVHRASATSPSVAYRLVLERPDRSSAADAERRIQHSGRRVV